MSHPRSRIGFKQEFQKSLNDIKNGVSTRESIINELGCNNALRSAIAYNFLIFDGETSKQPIDVQELKNCSFPPNNSGH